MCRIYFSFLYLVPEDVALLQRGTSGFFWYPPDMADGTRPAISWFSEIRIKGEAQVTISKRTIQFCLCASFQNLIASLREFILILTSKAIQFTRIAICHL